MTEKIKQVGIYTRVSTDDQAIDGYSMDAQQEAAMDYINKHEGWQLANVYPDGGYSGKSLDGRPALQRMLSDIALQKLDVVVFWKNSRLTRNVGDLQILLATFAKFDVEVHSLSEGQLVDNANGRLQANMLATFGQFERETISENVTSGMKKRAKLGYPNTKAPLGYKNGVDPETGMKTLLVVPEESKIVEAIFQMYTKGKGYRAIANHLNSLGYQTKRGNQFSTDAVKGILKNPTYVGLNHWGAYKDWEKYRRSKGKAEDEIVVKGKFEAIISEEMWENVQVRMSQATFQPKWKNDGQNILTGVLRCPQCGGPMRASYTTNRLKDGTKKRIRYYSCARSMDKPGSCSANSIQANSVESLVLQRTMEILAFTNFGKDVVKQLEDTIKEKKSEIIEAMGRKETQRTKIIGNMERYSKISKADPDFAPALLRQTENLRNELQALNSEIDELQSQIDGLLVIPTLDTVQSVLELIHKAVLQNRGDMKAIKVLFKVLLDKVTFDKHEKTVKIHYKLNNQIMTQLYDMLEKGETLTGSPFFAGTITFVA